MSPMFRHDTHFLSSGDNDIPIGLCYIAANLEKYGHEVKILDGQVVPEIENELEFIIKKENYEIIGFSSVTQTASGTIRLSNIVKKINPKITTIVGGVHPTVMGGEVLNQMPDIDIAAIGEGEITIVEILEYLQGKKHLNEIDGIAYRDEKNKIINNKKREIIKNLDDIPFPAYHLIDITKYTPPPGLFFRKPIVGMITARGCPFNCNFCADRVIWQGVCRLRKPESVLQEVELLAKKYGVKEIKFFDDTFTVNRKRTIEICEGIINLNLNIIWRCSSRVDSVDPELLLLMKKAGLRSISYGVESGDEEILKKMNKRIKLDQIRNAVKWSKEIGIETKGFFLLNYPGDTVETTEKTIAFSRELNLDFAGFNLIFPSYGTQVRKEIEENYEIDRDAWDNLDTPIGNEIYFHQKQLPAEYLKKAYHRAAIGFYLRPRAIWKAIKRIKNFEMLKSYIKGAIRLLKVKAKD